MAIDFGDPSIREAKDGNFSCAGDPAFESTTTRQKITINIKVKTIAVSEDQQVRERCDWLLNLERAEFLTQDGVLDRSRQINATTTKKDLAKAVINEVENALVSATVSHPQHLCLTSDNVYQDLGRNALLLFEGKKFIREITLDDLILGPLVKVAPASYRPTIKVRL